MYTDFYMFPFCAVKVRLFEVVQLSHYANLFFFVWDLNVSSNMQSLLSWWGGWCQRREQQGICLCDKVGPLMENTPAVFTGPILPSTSILKAHFKLCQLWKWESKKTPLQLQGTLLLHKVFGSCKDSRRCSAAHALGMSHPCTHALQRTAAQTVLC